MIAVWGHESGLSVFRLQHDENTKECSKQLREKLEIYETFVEHFLELSQTYCYEIKGMWHRCKSAHVTTVKEAQMMKKAANMSPRIKSVKE